MLTDRVIEKLSSAWGSPILLCLGFRKLNKVTKRDVYPLPYITNILDQFRSGRSWQLSTWSQRFGEYLCQKRASSSLLLQYQEEACSSCKHCQSDSISHLHLFELQTYVSAYLDDIVVAKENFKTHLKSWTRCSGDWRKKVNYVVRH